MGRHSSLQSSLESARVELEGQGLWPQGFGVGIVSEWGLGGAREQPSRLCRPATWPRQPLTLPSLPLLSTALGRLPDSSPLSAWTIYQLGLDSGGEGVGGGGSRADPLTALLKEAPG